jgi:hypothetical protein
MKTRPILQFRMLTYATLRVGLAVDAALGVLTHSFTWIHTLYSVAIQITAISNP